MLTFDALLGRLDRPRRTGAGFLAFCRAHDDRQRSLMVDRGREGQHLLHCFASCALSDVLASHGLTLADISPTGNGRLDEASRARLEHARREREEYAKQRRVEMRGRVATLWKEGLPGDPTGRLVRYLRARGLRGDVPAALRFHLGLPYYDDEGVLVGTFPAMLAAIERAGQLVGVHRTYLAPDDDGRAKLDPAKKILGEVKGGAIRLVPVTEDAAAVGYAEGIETALAVHEATTLPMYVAVSASNLGPALGETPPHVPTVYLWADHDPNGVGQRAAQAAAKGARPGCAVRVLVPEEPGDWLDVLTTAGPEVIRAAHAQACDAATEDAPRANGADPEPPSAPRAVNVRELLELEIAPREYLLEPILREKETAMLHAWRGVGKTYVGLEMAFAIATGGTFLGWQAPRPRRVLYLDGEMPARTMQERLAAIIRASNQADAFDPTYLQFVCADLQEEPLPSLATSAGQMLLGPFVAEADLVIVDSISTLAGYGKENEAESWLPMQAWALALRRRGKSVLLLHHDGKGGQQRGTSRKEDILDVVIHLRRPADYEPPQGARFEVHFPKARGLRGDAVEPFEAALEVVDGRTVWTTRKLDDAQLARAAALYRDGCKAGDVAQELGVSRATAYRLRTRAQEKGLLEGDSLSHGSHP